MTENQQEEISLPTQQKALEWIATLSAAGIAHRVVQRESAWFLLVSRDQAKAARDEIKAYEESNVGWPPVDETASFERPSTYKTWAAAWGVLFLIWFYIWIGPYDAEIAASSLGSANAARITQGEWWRIITALTIHANVSHLAGNALVLLLVAHAVCGMLGGGLGWLLIIISGAAGNIITALLSNPNHIGVGASTACFGAVGILSAYQTTLRLRGSNQWRNIWNRAWIPICAGLALLGFLGTGEGTDLTAHGFGFLSGAILGILTGFTGPKNLPEWQQRILELICITIVMMCWRAAFNSSI